ncbi:hypothetical protein E2320_014231, partial [Naja naja]
VLRSFQEWGIIGWITQIFPMSFGGIPKDKSQDQDISLARKDEVEPFPVSILSLSFPVDKMESPLFTESSSIGEAERGAGFPIQ